MVAPQKAWNAGILVELLEHRHAEDISVAESLTGWSGSPRIDFWVLKPTWTRLHTIGYEVKISRNDFLKDTKWRDYLPSCNQFFFVAPPKLIDPKELPSEAGLIEAFVNGQGLRIVKQSPDRKSDLGSVLNVLRHILMWRAGNQYEDRNKKAQQWKASISNRKDIGYKVAEVVNERVKKRVGEVEEENSKLAKENDSLQEIKRWATENKLDLRSWHITATLDKALKGHSRETLLEAKKVICELLGEGDNEHKVGEEG